jgi:hypothetical protein
LTNRNYQRGRDGFSRVDHNYRLVECTLCKREFVAYGRGHFRVCSNDCERKANTARHRSFVEHNLQHIRSYQKSRYARTWGKSSREIGTAAEIFAADRLLPTLGFTEIVNVTAYHRFIPFDIVATHNSRRVLIDVTTGQTKFGHHSAMHRAMADALRMPLLILFIKPDFKFYCLKLANQNSLYAKLSELRTIAVSI